MFGKLKNFLSIKSKASVEKDQYSISFTNINKEINKEHLKKSEYKYGSTVTMLQYLYH